MGSAIFMGLNKCASKNYCMYRVYTIHNQKTPRLLNLLICGLYCQSVADCLMFPLILFIVGYTILLFPNIEICSYHPDYPHDLLTNPLDKTDFIIILMCTAEHIFCCIHCLTSLCLEAHNPTVVFNLLKEDVGHFRLQ